MAYLLCRYYPLFLWPLVMWAYLLDHSHPVCTRVGNPVHILLAPCVSLIQSTTTFIRSLVCPLAILSSRYCPFAKNVAPVLTSDLPSCDGYEGIRFLGSESPRSLHPWVLLCWFARSRLLGILRKSRNAAPHILLGV